MSEPVPTDEEFHVEWQKPQRENGIEIATTFQDIQDFAYRSFEVMDKDSDGFVSRTELNFFLNSSATSLRAKSFIRFMLYRLNDIKKSFVEDVNPETDGISRGDIREYFDKLQFNG
jgi:Ca2+-binding EF-hand superfamily protein